ncbi:MAG: hypothetical protein RJA49_2406 [Actinomycetota bacterium]
MIEVPAAIVGAVTREVRSGSRDGTPTRIAIARRTYRTDPDDLWDALTNAERLPRWFLPITGELHVGGRYQLHGNAGGVIERCEPPTSFAVTWEMGPMVSWLAVTLRADGGGTTLELAHEAPVDPDRWTQYGPSAVGIGWDLSLMALGLHIESGAPVDPEEAAAFTLSPTGIEFAQMASSSWAAAAIADGDDAAAAHEAAARTVAFYTVVPDSGAGD